jgi:hypothetical protein
MIARWNAPKEASHNMLEQANCLLLNKLVDHVAEHSADSIEALVSLADVRKTNVVEEDLLYDKDGNGFAELGTRLHYAQAQWDDLGCQEEVDDFRRIVLYECANDTERSEAKILERARLGRCVEERVEEERDMRCRRSVMSNAVCDGIHTTQEEATSLGVGSDTLK